MIRDEAEKLSAVLTERFALQAPGVVAEVEAMSNRIEFAAPGGGRPTLVRYRIRIRDEARVGRLGLDEAQDLLDALGAVDAPAGPEGTAGSPGSAGSWGPDRVFEEIVARGGAVTPAE